MKARHRKISILDLVASCFYDYESSAFGYGVKPEYDNCRVLCRKGNREKSSK